MEQVERSVPGTAYDAGESGGGVRVVAYDPRRPDHVEAFRALNLAWITEHFTVEDADRRALDDPDGEILGPGGAIFLAEDERGRPVGACALVRHAGGDYELAKMAVSPEARGRGAGFALGAAVIAHARSLGLPRIELLSNTKLAPAIRLYRRLGFVEAPLGGTEYVRANIRMVMEL